jgi:hypothetical protein
MRARPYQTSGADGVKTAVLRKGRANLKFIWAAAHANGWATTAGMNVEITDYH